ncbi:MAG: EutN/CcmL family microcompartment protein [Pirellulaceae bacterium]|nr:EutN/CcmL family microcompartment protein [Pirellulaceae bacterium]
MQIYKVNGQVTLSRCHPSFIGGRLLTAHPIGEELMGRTITDPDLVVVWDDLGAGTGSTIAVSDGAEAAQAFKPALKPVDAYCAAILDQIHIHPKS